MGNHDLDGEVEARGGVAGWLFYESHFKDMKNEKEE